LISDAQLDDALERQAESAIGVLDAMHGDELHQCITQTQTDNLAILPVGGASMSDINQLAPSSLHRVIHEARSHFDTILVDTGPAPDSMESSIVASAADAVILTVCRGDRRPDVEQALQFLQRVGATLAGFVFNRAEAGDNAILSSYSKQTARLRNGSSRGRPTRRPRRGARPRWRPHNHLDPVTGALVGPSWRRPKRKHNN